MPSEPEIQLHSTRLFPKFEGASAYRISGIAQRCDLIILTDVSRPQVQERSQTSRGPITKIFLSMRAHVVAINYFHDKVLPRLVEPFILISGSEDITLPNQVDKRWPPLAEEHKSKLNRIASHPLLQKWFCENLDEKFHDKVHPLPVGHVPSASAPERTSTPIWEPTEARSKSILCAHRVRKGEQWALRDSVTRVAHEHWSDYCTIVETSVSSSEFDSLLQRHCFVLCVEGGGLDPSPKAWRALLHGAVPIIRDTATAEAYAGLPVVKISDWDPHSINIKKLDEWWLRFFGSGYMVEKRDSILTVLTLDHWYDHVFQGQN